MTAHRDAPERGGATILVVDDDRAIGDLLRAILRRAGYRVEHRGRGEEALAYVRSGAEIDLVILDLTLPEMSGRAVLAELRRSCPELPVLVSSGYIGEQERQELLALGARGCLPKPYRPAELRRVVREIIANSARAA
ncbi:MAG: response regulator [Planctomycetota bacterium]|nr:MAG: response regulator [Planctomycetota bacterium]